MTSWKQAPWKYLGTECSVHAPDDGDCTLHGGVLSRLRASIRRMEEFHEQERLSAEAEGTMHGIRSLARRN